VFDLIDCWMQQCIAKCIYHVDPPDGRHYETRPVNVAEAEGRRLERFQIASPSHSRVEIPGIEPNPTFPGTLDLRIPSPVSWNFTEKREFLS
jgi:uncharacterized protein (DUF2126 family)